MPGRSFAGSVGASALGGGVQLSAVRGACAAERVSAIEDAAKNSRDVFMALAPDGM